MQEGARLELRLARGMVADIMADPAYWVSAEHSTRGSDTMAAQFNGATSPKPTCTWRRLR